MQTKHLLLGRSSIVPASVIALLALGRPENGLVFSRNDEVIQAHRERQQTIADSIATIQARAEAESRDLTAEELREVNSFADEADQIEAQIAAHTRAIELQSRLTQPGGRQVPAEDDTGGDGAPQQQAQARPAAAAQPARVPPQARTTPHGTHGFRSFGDFASAVRMARGGNPDQRLIRGAATTYGSEGVGADGGFAVPPDFRTEIMGKVFAEDSLVARTDILRSASNTITVPVDMTTPWQSSGGIQAYWTAEGATKTQSKPVLEQVTVKASTLAVLVPVTEELLEDAPALDGYLRRKAPENMDFKISYAIAWGSGAGQPLGFMNAPALVTVAAEGAQTTDTINATNVVKMFSRMPVGSRKSAAWIIHPDAEPQLPLMTIGQQPVYVPAGGLSGAPFGTLLGRPVIPHQIAETVGDLGDIMFVDLNQYMTLLKTGGSRDANGMRQDTSIHLYFDQDMVAFRFTIRIGGQPWWSTATSPRDGSSTQSPFVTLASR